MTVAGKLYGAQYSTCTRRVLTTAKELGVEVELVIVDLTKGAHKAPEHLARQPFGQIPAFVDVDGTTVYESRAITRYLATKYRQNNPDLLPADVKAYGAVEQWASVEVSNFDPSISGLVAEHYFGPVFYNRQADPAKVEAHKKRAAEVLDVYEAHLSKHKFLAGDKFTLADLHHIPYAFHLVSYTPDKDLLLGRPHVKAWYESLVNRPSWKAVTA